MNKGKSRDGIRDNREDLGPLVHRLEDLRIAASSTHRARRSRWRHRKRGLTSNTDAYSC
jgi:hypothetical protein